MGTSGLKQYLGLGKFEACQAAKAGQSAYVMSLCGEIGSYCEALQSCQSVQMLKLLVWRPNGVTQI